MPDFSALRLVTALQVVQEQSRGALVLDTRPAEQFASLHIRGSVQIGLMGRFASWAAIILDPVQKLVLIAEDAERAREARNRLERVGLGQVIGYSLADKDQWRKQGLELATISIERCEQVQQSVPSLQLVDVRSRAEWLQGHLPGAISLPLLDLNARKRSIDLSRPSLVYCREGFRATTAASMLMKEGAAETAILIDGVEGWSALGLPLELPGTGTSDQRSLLSS